MVYFAMIFSTFSAYEILLMTIDKVIAVKIPHKAKSICTSERAKILSFINLSAYILYYIPMLDFSAIVPGTTQCSRFVKKSWYVTAYTYSSFLVYPLIPSVLLSVFNSLIIGVIWKRKTQRSNMVEINNKANAAEV